MEFLCVHGSQVHAGTHGGSAAGRHGASRRGRRMSVAALPPPPSAGMPPPLPLQPADRLCPMLPAAYVYRHGLLAAAAAAAAASFASAAAHPICHQVSRHRLSLRFERMCRFSALSLMPPTRRMH